MTTLAPVPGRKAEPGDTGDTEPGNASAEAREVDLTGPGSDPGPRVRPPAPTDLAGQATWLFGMALALITEGASEDVAMAEVLAEAAGRSRALEGAYGRAVALLSEFPGDPMVHRTVDLMAKALLRSRRPARAAEEA